MRRARTGLFAALLLLLTAHPIAADAFDRMRIADLSGSERLRLRAHGQALSSHRLPPPSIARMRQDMTRQGYYFDGGPPILVARDIRAAPLIAWDGNINGGVLQDRFVLNGLVFEANPDYRARSGIVTGASAGALLRYAWGSGRLIELRSAAEIGWSAEHGIGRADLLLSVCSRNHLVGWSFLDLCATGQRYWRDLGQGSARQVSASVSHVVSAPESLHEIRLEYMRASTTGRDQDRIAVRVESVWDRALTEIALTLGEPLDDAVSLRYRFSAGVGWIAAERGWRLDLWTQRAEGGRFLGVPREDRARGIGLATDLRPGTSLRLGYLDSRSTAGIANYDQVTLDIRFASLRW